MSATQAVLITGAAKRLGRHMALHLAQHGWDVVVHYGTSRADALQTVADIEALGVRAVAIQADLTDITACQRLMQDAVTAMPNLTALVNNASLFVHDVPSAASAESLQKHLQINTLAPILLSQTLFVHLQRLDKRGVVVNLLDQKLWNLNPDFFSYTLGKAALHTASTMMAQALSPTLRVMNVAPGMTLESYLAKDAQFEKLTAMRLTPDSQGALDVASSVLFALTNASMTGSTLMVDYGQHLMPFERDFSFMV